MSDRAEWRRIAEYLLEHPSIEFMCNVAIRLELADRKRELTLLGKAMGLGYAWGCGNGDEMCHEPHFLGTCEPRLLFLGLMEAMTDAERAELCRAAMRAEIRGEQ